MPKCKYEYKPYLTESFPLELLDCKEQSTENSEYCIFHDKNYFEGHEQEIADRFEDKVRNGINQNEPLICFGYYLPSIDVTEVTEGKPFAQPVYFNGATFSKKADFGGATFTGEANFGGATFTGEAYFKEVIFTEGANFGRATFFEEVYFFRATFSKKADFGGATFNKGAGFRVLHSWKKQNLRMLPSLK